MSRTSYLPSNPKLFRGVRHGTWKVKGFLETITMRKFEVSMSQEGRELGLGGVVSGGILSPWVKYSSAALGV